MSVFVSAISTNLQSSTVRIIFIHCCGFEFASRLIRTPLEIEPCEKAW